MNVILSFNEFFEVFYFSVGESALPSWEFGVKFMREASLYKHQSSFESYADRRKQQMNMVRHDNKRMQFVMALFSIVLQGFKE